MVNSQREIDPGESDADTRPHLTRRDHLRRSCAPRVRGARRPHDAGRRHARRRASALALQAGAQPCRARLTGRRGDRSRTRGAPRRRGRRRRRCAGRGSWCSRARSAASHTNARSRSACCSRPEANSRSSPRCSRSRARRMLAVAAELSGPDHALDSARTLTAWANGFVEHGALGRIPPWRRRGAAPSSSAFIDLRMRSARAPV